MEQHRSGGNKTNIPTKTRTGGLVTWRKKEDSNEENKNEQHRNGGKQQKLPQF